MLWEVDVVSKEAAGDHAAAWSHGDKAFAILKTLVSQNPRNTSWQKDLSVSHGRLGELAHATGDIEAAQETGVHIAAVTWGYNSRSALEEAAPDYLFESPAQVLEFLAAWPPEKSAE